MQNINHATNIFTMRMQPVAWKMPIQQSNKETYHQPENLKMSVLDWKDQEDLMEK